MSQQLRSGIGTYVNNVLNFIQFKKYVFSK